MKRRQTMTRTDILAIILTGCMAIFVLRLFWLQVIKHGEYVAIAKRSQQRSFVIPATRGEIYMKDNGKAVPVVLNQAVYMVIADPSIVKSSDRTKIMTALRDAAGGEMVKDAQTRLENTKSRYEILARNITRTQAEALKKHDFSGIGFQQASVRNYPEGQLAAQVLGFVNAEGKGQYGVEQGLDEKLKGRDGLLQSVTDVRNVPLTVGKDNVRVEPKAGENVVLTIDRNVQSYAEEALKRGIESANATEGSVLIANPNTGEIVAMANFPTFSPAEYGQATDASVFMNSTTLVPFEPGSVGKAFTMAMALDKGVITPDSTYVNTDRLQVGDRVMENALKGHTGVTTMQQVLNLSLNTGTITAARRLGDGTHVNAQAREIMYDYFYQKFGLGRKTGIEIGEESGLIYPTTSTEGNEVRYSTMTFGQGMNVTMVQMVAGFCSIINGGEYYQPTLIAGSVDSDGAVSLETKKPLRRTISEGASTQVRNMLVTARGSSAAGRADPGGYSIGGKTGTAETISSSGSYTKTETVATYLGFGGSEKPEYVIMVRVAAPGKGLNLEGGIHAGPIFSDISKWLLNYMKVSPRS